MSDYVTKDSGVRAAYESGMVRDTQEGKARFDLLLAEGIPYEEQFLTRVADLMQRGEEKYGARNWEKANSAEEVERFRASAIRHLAQWHCGDKDEDHASAVVFNLMAAEMTEYKLSQEPKSDPADTEIRAWVKRNPEAFSAWVAREIRIQGGIKY
jgi:hypothetical protein